MMTPEDEVQKPAPSKFYDPITERIERRHLIDTLAEQMALASLQDATTVPGVTPLHRGSDWGDMSASAKEWALQMSRPYAEHAVDAGWRPTNADELAARDERIRKDATLKVARSLRTMAKAARSDHMTALLKKIAEKIELEVRQP